MTRARVAYSSVASIQGPLVLVEGVEEIGWDELAEITADLGPPRHGVVLEVRVTSPSSRSSRAQAACASTTLASPSPALPCALRSAKAWLGRVCNGLGEPLDGGPPVFGVERREVAGRPINPAGGRRRGT